MQVGVRRGRHRSRITGYAGDSRQRNTGEVEFDGAYRDCGQIQQAEGGAVRTGFSLELCSPRWTP